jgi:hypothetical protein
MSAEAVPWEEERLTPEERLQWRADVAALTSFRDQGELLALKMGDLFNEQKARWGKKMPALAKEAGVPYHQARQRAHVAACLPPDSRYRTMGLPFSILRMIVSLPEPRPWAEKARALQMARKLKVRDFARMLEAAGLRQRRPRKVPRCLHCAREVAETPARLFLRTAETTGWLCNRACLLAYLNRLNPSDPVPEDNPPSPSSCSSGTSLLNLESQSAAGEFGLAHRYSGFRSTPSRARDPPGGG